MRVNNNKTAKIVVLADSKVLARKAVRQRLDSEGVLAITLAAKRESSIETRVMQTMAAVDGEWIVVLLGAGDQMNYRTVVPELIAGGVDDVIVVAEKENYSALDVSLERAKTTLAVIAAITSTGHLRGQSRAMQAVRKTAACCIQSRTLPALILGETGTGKGQVAKAIHHADTRRNQHPFHTLDCGGITDSLFGSELFGHVRGAYSGALQNRSGAFESAGEGTLLLDEVGELSLSTQSYLLNALQERAYRPVGSDRRLDVRCRFIAATNRSLTEDIEERRFRRDLYYRLNGNRIRMPALRDHLSDVEELFANFLATERRSEEKIDIEPEVLDVLKSQKYPGNVRELETIAQRTASRMGDERCVRLAHLPFDRMRVGEDGDSSGKTVEYMVEHGMRMRDIEAEIARQAAHAALNILAAKHPNNPRTILVKQAAHSLGVSPRTIYNKLNGADRTP